MYSIFIRQSSMQSLTKIRHYFGGGGGRIQFNRNRESRQTKKLNQMLDFHESLQGRLSSKYLQICERNFQYQPSHKEPADFLNVQGKLARILGLNSFSLMQNSLLVCCIKKRIDTFGPWCLTLAIS